jgi:hypothetical protein
MIGLNAALGSSALYSENDNLEKHVSKETYEFIKKETGGWVFPKR